MIKETLREKGRRRGGGSWDVEERRRWC